MIKDMKLSSSSGLGVATIFTVLLILCLTVFSVLTLASAQADLRLTQKNALMVSSYYDGDNEAWAVSSLITSFWPSGAPKPDTGQCLALERQISDFSPGVSYASVAEYETGFLAEYDISVDINLDLNVSIVMPESGVYSILAWRLTPVQQVIYENPLLVWPGEM